MDRQETTICYDTIEPNLKQKNPILLLLIIRKKPQKPLKMATRKWILF